MAAFTMNRPDVANAQDTSPDRRHRRRLRPGRRRRRRSTWWSWPATGKHFSAGHDLKALVGSDEPDEWVTMRATPEGKFRHEQVMYFDRCQRIYHFRKPTIAAVQGACVAAGLMLACMCDLIVASDDATLPEPRAADDRGRGGAPGRALGAGHPQGQGVPVDRARSSTPPRPGAWAWSTGWSPRAELAERVAELADRVALVPPATAQVVKDSLNNTATLMGKEQSWKYHFMAHHWMHNTATGHHRAPGPPAEDVHVGGLRRGHRD